MTLETVAWLINGVSLVLMLPAFGIAAYYFFLLLSARRKSLDTSVRNNIPLHRFAVIIPAHNEEVVLKRTLDAVMLLDYPKDLYDVFVIADNCTDSTAEIARKAGVICLERNDLRDKGKGFALRWAFGEILNNGHDALVVLDADCLIDSHALRVFDERISRGAMVLQTDYVASNPDDSALSYAMVVGNRIENELYCAAKCRLGLSVFLQGTGMVFRREVLLEHSWNAYSIVEDVEYGIELLKKGLRVDFVSEVKIFSRFPATREQLRAQRIRWASGNVSLGKVHALPLITAGVTKRDWVLADAGWTLLVQSRPLIMAEAVAAAGVAGFGTWLSPGIFSFVMLILGSFAVGVHVCSLALGIYRVGLTRRRVIFLLGLPIAVAQLLAISFLGLIGKNKDLWVRTPR